MAKTSGRWIAPRGSYWSTKSQHEVAFHARYLELLLDNLMRNPPATPLWCRHALKYLNCSREERQKQAWKGPLPKTVLLEAMSDPLRDEALWSMARILEQLYNTQEFGAETPGLMLVPDDRYFVHRASAALPAPEAHATLTLLAWTRILTELGDTVYIDMMLWSVQVARPKLVLGDLLEGLTETLKGHGTARRKEGDEAKWADAWASLEQRLPAVLGSRRSQPIAGLTLAEADAFVGDVLREAPQPFIPGGYSGVRELRLRALGDALAGVLEALPEEPPSLEEYLSLEARRIPLERAAADEVRRQLQGASFDVTLPVRVAVAAKLPAPFEPLGFDLAEDAADLEFARKDLGVLYARFAGLEATGPDHAVEKARSRVRLALARAGMFAASVVGFDIVDAFVRYTGTRMWGTANRRWRIRAAALDNDSFTAVAAIADLLLAGDDLAVRIQEAIIHLHRASLAADSEEAFDEAWKVLEIMTAEASTTGASLIAYFPLMKAPRGLKKMSGSERDAFVKAQYQENLNLFEQIASIRNENVIHRNIARADWHVLEQHAAVAISFARAAVELAISAWKSSSLAARDRTGLKKCLDAGYKTLSITLPKQSDLRPE